MRLFLRLEIVERKVIPQIECMAPTAILPGSHGMCSVGIPYLYIVEGGSGKKEEPVVHFP